MWRHRQELPNNVKLFGEIGYVSDRNFIEQYYEPEFDRGKDQENSIRIKQDLGSFSGQLWAQSAVERFRDDDRVASPSRCLRLVVSAAGRSHHMVAPQQCRVRSSASG